MIKPKFKVDDIIQNYYDQVDKTIVTDVIIHDDDWYYKCITPNGEVTYVGKDEENEWYNEQERV